MLKLDELRTQKIEDMRIEFFLLNLKGHRIKLLQTDYDITQQSLLFPMKQRKDILENVYLAKRLS